MPSYAGVSANVASLILPPSVAGGSFAELFTLLGNPPGVAYDFTAAGGLTQDIGGLNPVTAAAQSIGLAHDYARASSWWVSGTELVPAGTWTAGSGAVLSAQTDSGFTIAAPSGDNFTTAFKVISLVAGRLYLVTANCVTTVAGGALFRLSPDVGSAGLLIDRNIGSGTTQINVVVKAEQSSYQIGVAQSAALTTNVLSGISVREITGNPLLAPSDIRRPTWGAMANGLPCSVWDGTRAMATAAAVDYSAHDQITVMAAVRKLSDAAAGIIAELGPGADVTNGTFALSHSTFVTSGTRTNYALWSRNTNSLTRGYFGYAQPHSALIVSTIRLSAGQIHDMRVNGAVATATESSGSDGTARNFLSGILNIGARNAASPSLFFNGNIARIAAIGGTLTTEQLTYAVSLISRGFAPSP